MKIHFTCDFSFGLFWDRHRRALSFFPLPFLGVRFELGGGAVQKALPAASPSDEDAMMRIVVDHPTECWAELKKYFGGISLTRMITARDRLIASERLQVMTIEHNGLNRRVLAPVVK